MSKAKILCLHGAGSNKEGFKVAIANITNGLPDYECVFINGPFSAQKSEEAPITYSWIDFSKLSNGEFGMDCFVEGLELVKNIWDDSFGTLILRLILVGLIAWSQGSLLALLSTGIVNPAPQFAILTGTIVPPRLVFSSEVYETIQKWNGSCLDVNGIEEGVSFVNKLVGSQSELSHDGAHPPPTDEVSVQKILNWHRSISSTTTEDITSSNSNWTVMSNPKDKAVIEALKSSNQVILQNYGATLQKATLTILRTHDDLNSVNSWPKSEITNRATQIAQSIEILDNHTILRFDHLIPENSKGILHIEFSSANIHRLPFFNSSGSCQVNMIVPDGYTSKDETVLDKVTFNTVTYDAVKYAFTNPIEGCVFSLPHIEWESKA
ncbi:hypothetical protein HDV02_001574 [Globomyces sp. JEL0801]|nr:hypothetical protein HDV02_001574 [Globomyces sp. JEL0801]